MQITNSFTKWAVYSDLVYAFLSVFRLMDFPASWKPWVDAAIEQAELSLSQGGKPIGAVLVRTKKERSFHEDTMKIFKQEISRCMLKQFA